MDWNPQGGKASKNTSKRKESETKGDKRENLRKRVSKEKRESERKR